MTGFLQSGFVGHDQPAPIGVVLTGLAVDCHADVDFVFGK